MLSEANYGLCMKTTCRHLLTAALFVRVALAEEVIKNPEKNTLRHCITAHNVSTRALKNS